MRLKLLILSFPIVVTGCSTFGITQATEQNVALVKVGESPEEVEKQIGSPESKVAGANGREEWSYQILSQSRTYYRPYKLYFSKSKLAEIFFDTIGSQADQKLREQRNKANQECMDLTGSCKAAPPIQK